MRIKLKKETMCAHDVHEMTLYPRKGFQAKPVLPEGTILEVNEKWINLYGVYYRCGEYDIPVENAEIIEE